MKIAINIISKMALSLIFFLCIGTTTSYAQWEEELPPVCVGDCDGNGGDDDGGGGCTDPCSCYGDCGGGDDDGGGCTDPCSCYGDCNGSDGSSGGGNNGGGSGSNWSNASEFGTAVNFTIASSNNPIRLRVYTVNSLPAAETIPIGLMILEIGEMDLSGLITDYEEATGDYGSLNSPDLLMYNLEYHRDNANNLSEFAAASYRQEINGYNATLQFFNWIAEGLVADLSGDYPGGVRVHGDPTPFETYYLDKDGDGYYYEARQAQRPLTPDWKTVTNGIDCDDTNAAITTGCTFTNCKKIVGYLPVEAVENTNDVPGRDLGNATTLATAILRDEAGYRIPATNCNTGRVPLGSVVKVTGNGSMRYLTHSDGSTEFSGFYPVEYDECGLGNRDLLNCTSIGGSNQQQGSPYVAQAGDKFAKPNIPTTMAKQILNTCVSSGMGYLAKIFGKNVSNEKFEQYYYNQFGINLMFRGVDYSKMTVFASHFFETNSFIGITQAIDQGYFLMTNLDEGGGNYHNVVIVGYHPNGDYIYMDPIYGNLREAPPSNFPRNYIVTIKDYK